VKGTGEKTRLPGWETYMGLMKYDLDRLKEAMQ